MGDPHLCFGRYSPHIPILGLMTSKSQSDKKMTFLLKRPKKIKKLSFNAITSKSVVILYVLTVYRVDNVNAMINVITVINYSEY